ncbi:MAG: DUF3969 family protein [Cystobacterineae bacterium]|nr:DUF3969 family protein [Cystobacterineae bacterium]
MSNLFLKITGKQEIERFMALLCLGLIEAIKTNALSLPAASHCLISPYSIQVLKEKGMGEELESLLHLLCELEAVKRIIPDKFNSSIEDVENKLKLFLDTLTPPSLPQEYWIEDK